MRALPLRPALALALAALPTLAMAQQVTQPDTGTACLRLMAPLERQLKEAKPRLDQAGNPKNREAVQSRLLFELLKGEDKTLARMLTCLAAQRR